MSEQILGYCKDSGFVTLAISSNEREDQCTDGCITIENRPRHRATGGLAFHWSRLSYALYLARRAKSFGADLAIIDSGTTHYFALFALRVLRIPVAINMHNSLWPAGYPPTRLSGRLVRRLNGLFFRRGLTAATGASPECERQLKMEARANQVPFFQFRYQFSSDGFHQAQAYDGGTFRIAYVGRVEADKGALALIDIAKHLRAAQIDFSFDVCGDGTALPELRARVAGEGLSSKFNLHGHLPRERLLKVYAAAHALVVPTTSEFCEGMPQVCAEAVLSGLPIVTSKTSNALDVIGPAIVEVQTDQPETYAKALVELARNSQLCSSLRRNCGRLRLQFLDRAQGYAAATERLLVSLGYAEMHRR